MSAVIQATRVRDEGGAWLRAILFVVVVLGLMALASTAYASDGTEFDAAVSKWDQWVKGNLGKLAALIALGVGSVVAAVKKDWSWFMGAVVLSMGIGVIVGIINASFSATV
ncbi:TrbC/VirB2 family protein [Herbaspirillum aquaticum]|uniref:TrbC/VirB2 family protein n=1 Tax=Herbaspirillum aquaticum TaxID=568783 RepID=UPI0024DE8DB4|nr:TrbC/VirB2 family protein [Herbaspirillum aquaticum]